MRLRWWKRPRLTIEQQLERRLETRGIGGFIVVPTAEAMFYPRTRPGPSPAVLPDDPEPECLGAPR